MPAVQAKHWVITDNAGTRDKWERLLQERAEEIKYAAWQVEEGTHQHIQGYLWFNKKVTADYSKRFVGDNPHVEKAKKLVCDESCARARAKYDLGLDKDPNDHPCARHYVMKGYTRVEGPWEHGEHKSKQGKRNDLDDVKEALDKGGSMREIYRDHFKTAAKYSRFFKEYREVMREPRRWPMEITIIAGETGQGKSRYVWDMFPDARKVFRVTNDKTYPFSGYDGEEDVYWEEFDGSRCDLKDMLQLMDRYPYRVRGLYGVHEFVGKRLYITSNKFPWEWYAGAHPEHQKALKRRVQEFGKILTPDGADGLMPVQWPEPNQ